MERDYGQEIDGLKQELGEMRDQLTSVLDLLTASASELKGLGDQRKHGLDGREYVGHVQKMKRMHPDPNINALMDECENACGQDGDTGNITYLGVFASGGNQSSWVKKGVSGNDLLSLAENGTAKSVLACIGSQEKLNILTALLRKPSNVAQLVEKCGFGSTGQVYHHLKPLLAADLICELRTRKGYYEVSAHRVQGIVMILCGIADLTDSRYGLSRFEKAADEAEEEGNAVTEV